MVAKGKAFAPGHITGFFEIRDEAPKLENKGSRGAGLSIDLGVTTEVTISEGPRDVSIVLNGSPDEAKTTRDALDALIPPGDLRVSVFSEYSLPVSQGFGISGAGALSAGLALKRALQDYNGQLLEFAKVVNAAHCAEVKNRTGLGDVAAQVMGGFEIRRTPGLPAERNVLRLDQLYGMDSPPIVILCVIGKERYTPSILSDPVKREAINKMGGPLIDALMNQPSLELFMKNSYRFVHDSGLMTAEVDQAIETVSEITMASMSCLGESIFCVCLGEPMADEVSLSLAKFGKVYVCSVDQQGARILE